MHPLSLEQLTIFEASPPDLVSIAATLGCQAISLYMHPIGDAFPVAPLLGDTIVRRATAQRCAETGVAVHTLEGFPLSPDTAIDSLRRAMESGAWLGAKQLTTGEYGLEPAAVVERFAELCVLASQFRLNVNLEFVGFSSVRSLQEAVAVVTGAAQPNAGIVVDSLHLTRSGGSPADLANIDPALIGLAHVCDGPLQAFEDPYMTEAAYERQIPGKGEFPLRAFVAALPPEVMIGVEVPSRRLRQQGVPPLERARRAVEATRQLLGN
jgi:sugar phosphate isomerase/epimerase